VLIKCASPVFIAYVALLFQMILNLRIVPSNFLVGIVVPIIKDAQGNAFDPNNYRGVTLSSTLSKVFEYVVRFK